MATKSGRAPGAGKKSGPLPNEVTLALGASLRTYRLAAGKTQVGLAFDAEVERSRISKIEGGRINPSLLTLATLCYCLGITLPELFTGIRATIAPVAAGGKPRRANQAVLEKPQKPRQSNRAED
jgi:transcriptional regulator with XRE-family HTH domain